MTVENPQIETQPPSARALRAMAIVRWVLVVLSLSAAVFAWTAYFSPASSEGAAARYQCPMHPQITSPDPGECPICHMALEPIQHGGRSAKSAGAATKPPPSATSSANANASKSANASASAPGATGYTCPMHPAVHSDHPGSCPICKMDLVPEKPPQKPPGAADSTEPVPGVTGVTSIELSFDRAQAIGVRTVPVVVQSAEPALRVTASVAPIEGRSSEVRVRAAGFVERVVVGDAGGKVKRGQELVAVYSPEIYQAFSDFVLAARWAEGGENATTLAATRRRLELLGVSGPVLDRALERKEAPRTLSLVAPASGYVLEKNVTLGSYVTPDMALYRIVNLDRVFVVADVPSTDLARVAPGQKARFVPTARPGLDIQAEVALVYPQIAEPGRTARLRLEIDNRKLGLLPGEFGTLELSVPAREATWVPRDALVDTGLDRYVFVEIETGHYQPRHVETGATTPDRIEILRGVSAGEKVVSGATFLVDSESRLRAALTTRSPQGGAEGATPPAPK